MKTYSYKLLIVPALILCVSFLITQKTEAQERGMFTIGAGVSAGLEADDYGIGEVQDVAIQAYATYNVTNNFRLGADFTYWFIDDSNLLIHGNVMNQSIIFTQYEINSLLHYSVFNGKRVNLYGLGLLGVHYNGVEITEPIEAGTGVDAFQGSDTKLGVGFGGGIEFSLGLVRIYAEPRYVFRGIEQFTVNTGIRLAF